MISSSPPLGSGTCTLGTRGSALALAQAELTRSALQRAWPELSLETRVFVTRGDRKLDLDLMREPAGGKGLFTKELEEALLSGAIDVAVHSLKDLPGHNPAGLEITAVLERAARGDTLISKVPGGLDALPFGARIGTSSVRRARQLHWLRGDLQIQQWRGNVQTRLQKLSNAEDVVAIVLAEAGLERLGFDLSAGRLRAAEAHFYAVSLADRILPAIGQGAIALQARADRPEVRNLLRAVDHAPTHVVIRAERELQRLLSGDCTLPVGVRATMREQELEMEAILFPAEGVGVPATARVIGRSSEPEKVAADLHAHLLGGRISAPH